MWIIDSRYRGGVELWIKNGKYVSRRVENYRPSFYFHLPDPHPYVDMLESLASRYRMEEYTFRSIYGEIEGYRIEAGRGVAEAIERETRFSAKLYNVDVRMDQRFMAERGISHCRRDDESRFDIEFDIPLNSIEIRVDSDPHVDTELSSIEITDGETTRLEGKERVILSDLFSLLDSMDPDIVIFPHSDLWMSILIGKARKYDLSVPISRSGRFSGLESKSYWSYGKVKHRPDALIPHGRILIDPVSSFNYEASGLRGLILASRIAGLSPNLTSRFTPGTLISSYEVYEAVRRGIAVPFRKEDAERTRSFRELKAVDRGGMMFQPEARVYENVYQLDFTSLYPSIIVKYNLSPETLEKNEPRGFLAEVLAPVLEFRMKIKELKKRDPKYAELDALLKWMLITSFGYTGYRNAKFGSIEVHERITSISREILMRVKEMAESSGYEVLHGIVDCLWLIGDPILELKEKVEAETGLMTELETYDWLVFLPMTDGTGAYNRYYGRLSDGTMKVRGVMTNRKDTPPYVKRMQRELFDRMSEARNLRQLREVGDGLRETFSRYSNELRNAEPKELLVRRDVSTLEYSKRCPEASAIEAYRELGIELSPGMKIGYIVRDSKRWIVDTEWSASNFDVKYYGKLLEKAWEEIAFPLQTAI